MGEVPVVEVVAEDIGMENVMGDDFREAQEYNGIPEDSREVEIFKDHVGMEVDVEKEEVGSKNIQREFMYAEATEPQGDHRSREGDLDISDFSDVTNKKINDELKFYSGFKDHNHFMAVFNSLGPNAYTLMYHQSGSARRTRLLTPENEFFLPW